MEDEAQTKINVSTDLVATLDDSIHSGIPNNVSIVLIKRLYEPYKDKLCLPGGFFEPDKDLNTCESCRREARGEIGLDLTSWSLDLLTILDEKGRDPRPHGPRISIVYWLQMNMGLFAKLKAGDDAKEIVIKNLYELEPDEIGFDHWRAICAVMDRIKKMEEDAEELRNANRIITHEISRRFER